MVFIVCNIFYQCCCEECMAAAQKLQRGKFVGSFSSLLPVYLKNNSDLEWKPASARQARQSAKKACMTCSRGRQPTACWPHPACSHFTNCSNDTIRLVVGYFVLLIYLPCNYLALYTYEKLSYQKSNFVG